MNQQARKRLLFFTSKALLPFLSLCVPRPSSHPTSPWGPSFNLQLEWISASLQRIQPPFSNLSGSHCPHCPHCPFFFPPWSGRLAMIPHPHHSQAVGEGCGPRCCRSHKGQCSGLPSVQGTQSGTVSLLLGLAAII